MKKLSLKTRLMALCVFMLSLSLTIAAAGYYGLHKVESSYADVSDRVSPSLNALNDMFLSYRAIRINLRTLGIPGLSKEQADEAIANVHEAIADYEKYDKTYQELIAGAEQKKIYEDLNGTWIHFKKIGELALGYYKSYNPNEKAKVIKIFLDDCPKAAAAYTTEVKKLKTYHADESKNSVQIAKDHATSANKAIASFSLLCAICGLLFGYLLSAGITKAISLVAMTLGENSNELFADSQEIATSSRSLAESNIRQAAAIQETASSLEEITAMITKASDNANTAAVSSQDSMKRAQEGRESVEKMRSSINDINQSNHEIMEQVSLGNDKISKIVKVIEEIGNKTKIINDIVFQTKLLSFNASVEAARAGESGKGFSVVAEEIGSLAQVSGNAAREITDLLEKSTSEVNNIVKETRSRVESSMEKGREKVDFGVKVAEKCTLILNSIVDEVSRVSTLAQEIATTSKEQTLGVTEINKAMNQLDSETQNNASASQQASSAAVQLSSQSQSMKTAVTNLTKVVYGDSHSMKIETSIGRKTGSKEVPSFETNSSETLKRKAA